MLMSMASMFLIVLFPENTILTEVLLWVSRIFTIVPTLYYALITGISMRAIASFGNKLSPHKNSRAVKIFEASRRIYTTMVLVGAMTGFMLLNLIGYNQGASFT
jgi:hypothetical protein